MAYEFVIVLLLLCLVILLILSAFSKYLYAFGWDFLDFALSFADEPFGGAMGFDWGDWIAALIIFSRERKVSGNMIAYLVAIEAANFIPGLDYVTNVVPAVFLSRLFFAKYHLAQVKLKGLKREIENAHTLGVPATDTIHARHNIKKIKQMIKKGMPADAEQRADRETARLEKDELQNLYDNIDHKLDHLITLIHNNEHNLSSKVINQAREAANYTRGELDRIHSIMESGDATEMRKVREDVAEFDKKLGKGIKEIESNINDIINKRQQGFMRRVAWGPR